ncbi:hypothetical protein [uncultured Gemmiger sp.]|uniref:hypothetical protein n=1 Tax=uncultured Gemmiger sp. TaxID=1623490 RepID=UPI0025FC14D8|nr:hypothetical protein [uncultured Gemmiger sp.]
MIGNTGYATLQAAIDNAANNAVITLQSDLEMKEGLRFIGSDDSSVPRKNITLDADNKHSLTLNNLGIYATRCNVTIKNCPALTVHAGKNPGNAHGENANISAVFFYSGTLTLDNCKTVNITNVEPITEGGSGLCIYNGGDLYVQNHTNFTVSGFMSGTPGPGEQGKGGCSGIYIDSDKKINHDYKTITGQIKVSDNSSLTATKCYHNGITANPVNITVTKSSVIDVNNNNPGNGAGKGGLGCYFGSLTVSENSSVKAHNNTAMQFAIYVHGFDVDGSSEIEAIDNGLPVGGYGIATDGRSVLRSGAKLTAEGNCGPGVAVCYDYNFKSDPELVVEDGATLSSCRNYNYGLANDSLFTVESGAHVILNENLFGGLDNYPYATTTVKENADLVIKDNYGVGINNGNNDPSDDPENPPYTDDPDAVAKLDIMSGLITENNKKTQMPYRGIGYIPVSSLAYGGGICNRYGDVTISSAVKVYNNHAEVAGDDLYNYNNNNVDAKSPNNFTITVVPGANGCVLHDGKYIDYWYKDESSKRWSEDDAIQYTDSIVGAGDALKAAHDINADIYVPEPEQPNEPKPNPAPEPKPDPKPEPKPNPAPVEPSASPEPDVTPTPTPAAAPSAIPQTGDTLPLVPLGLAALGSITALCVLQKRRKSKS